MGDIIEGLVIVLMCAALLYNQFYKSNNNG